MAKAVTSKKSGEPTMRELKTAIDGLAQVVKIGFEGSNKRMDKFDKRMDGFGKRMDKFDKRMDGFDKRMDGLDVKIDTKFDILDKKIDDNFAVLNEKIENEVENLAQMVQRQFMDTQEDIAKIQQDVSELKDGQARIEANLSGAARNIDLMDLRAEVEILKRKV